MNPRLIAYLRSLGLSRDADQDAAWEFCRGLRGREATIANLLNHDENDSLARSACDQALTALEVDPSEPTRSLAAAATPAAGAADGSQDDAASRGALDLPPAREAILSEERARRSAIRELAELSGTPDEVLAPMLDDPGVSVDAARQRILTDHRERSRAVVPPDAPAGHTRNSQTNADANTLAAALLLRQGVNDPTRHWYEHNPANGLSRFVDRTNDPTIGRAVDEGWAMVDASLADIAARCLRASGVHCESTARSVIAATQRSTPVSTMLLTNVFTQTFGALLLSAFEETEDTTGAWTSERENPNFFSIPRNRVGKMGALSKLPEGSTADHMDYTDQAENTRVHRYAGQFVIDEQSLINDYFGALQSTTPEEMGRAARRLRPDLVYALLLANPTMRDAVALFNLATHANLRTSTALNFGNLQTLLTDVMIQQEDGVNLNLRPKFLIVPESLRFTAEDLLDSRAPVIITGSTDSTRTASNTMSRMGIQVIADSRLDNGVTDPESGTAQTGSTTDWYVAAGSESHTVEVTFLRGSSRSPEMRSSVLNQGQWGIGFDVKMDIGAKALAWEGIAKAEA